MDFHAAFKALPFFLTTTTAAFAEPATPDGATRLLGVLQSYLGQTEGVVTVTPVGETYDVALDFAPLVGLIPETGATASMTPFAFSLTDRGDGTWAMTQDQAFSMQLSVPGAIEATLDIGSLRGTGIFDEKLSAFATSSMDLTDLKVREIIAQPEVGDQTVAYTVASGHFASTSTVAGVGVDQAMTYSVDGLQETFAMPLLPGAPPTEIGVTVDHYAVYGTSKGLRPDAIYKVMAWFVAHPSADAIKVDQAGLKALLTAGVPFFENVNAVGTLSHVRISTPLGVFGAETAGVTVDVNGIVADGLFREGFSFAGLSLPDGLVPAWAVDLVPDSLALDLKATRFNLAAPAALFIGAFDLAAQEPVDATVGAQMLSALLPDGVVDLTLAPGNVTSGLYDLRFEGVMRAGPAREIPTGRARITAAGMSAVEAALSSAPPEVSAQILPMLGMAKGLAKPEADGVLSWEIDATTPGMLLVNGASLMGGQ